MPTRFMPALPAAELEGGAVTETRLVRQVRLTRNSQSLICWLDADKRVKRGSWVTLLDGPEGWWRVAKVYNEIAMDKQDINRTWKVGGLQ